MGRELLVVEDVLGGDFDAVVDHAAVGGRLILEDLADVGVLDVSHVVPRGRLLLLAHLQPLLVVVARRFLDGGLALGAEVGRRGDPAAARSHSHLYLVGSHGIVGTHGRVRCNNGIDFEPNLAILVGAHFINGNKVINYVFTIYL